MAYDNEEERLEATVDYGCVVYLLFILTMVLLVATFYLHRHW